MFFLEKLTFYDNIFIKNENANIDSANINNVNKIFQRIKKKFICYLIIIWMFNVYFTIHVDIFCSINKKTQIEVLKDFGLSYIISLASTLIVGLIVCFSRLIGIKCNIRFIFVISQVLFKINFI